MFQGHQTKKTASSLFYIYLSGVQFFIQRDAAAAERKMTK